MKVQIRVRDDYSLWTIEDYITKLHNLRLKINRNHESGKKGSFEKESDLLNEYHSILNNLMNYLIVVDWR